MKPNILILIALTTIMWSCVKSPTEPEEPWSEATIETMAPVSVSLENAVLQGRSHNKSETITQRGFLFSDLEIDLNQVASNGGNIDKVQQLVAEGTEDGIFTVALKELVIGSTYYFAAYIKLSDGQIKVGEQKDFQPDYLDIEPATAPQSTVTVDSYKAVTATLELNSFGTDNLKGLEFQMFKVYDVGVYYWEDGSGSKESALKVSYNCSEEEKNALKEGQKIDILVTGLRGGITYKCIPYIQIGLYRSYADYVYLMEEVIGTESTFTTKPTPAAEVETLEALAITTTSGILQGKLLSDAGDENAIYGFCFSQNSADLEQHKYEVDSRDENDLFVKKMEDLSFATTYYYKAFVSVRVGESDEATTYGTTMQFTTVELKKPVLIVAQMDYAYRLEHVTTTSAIITCNITEGMNSSLTPSSCKVSWGTDANNLINESNAENIEESGTFTVTLTGLTQGTTYYFLPTVSNAVGTSEYSQVNSFRTPVSGREYLFDPTIVDSYLLNRMSSTLSDCTDLVYHELDAIVSGATTYYLLDRNLNSRAPFEKSDVGKALSQTSVDLWQKAGGLYLWGYTTPSYTWNIPGVTVLKDNPPYNWNDINPIKMTGPQWPENPCPEGYTIPTQQEYIDMINIAKGGNSASMANVFDAMRIGPTSGQKGNNGNTNEGVKDAMMHTLDGHVTEDGKIKIVKIMESSINTNLEYSRNNPVAVRCVRVVNQ